MSLLRSINEFDIRKIIETISGFTIKKVILDEEIKLTDEVLEVQKQFTKNYQLYKEYNNRQDLINLHYTIQKYFANINEYLNMVEFINNVKKISKSDEKKKLDVLLDLYKNKLSNSPDINLDRMHINHLANYLNKNYSYEYRVPPTKEIKEGIFKKRSVKSNLFNIVNRLPVVRSNYYDNSMYKLISFESGDSIDVYPQQIKPLQLQTLHNTGIDIIVKNYDYMNQRNGGNAFTVFKQRDISFFKNLVRNTYQIKIDSLFIEKGYQYKFTEIFNHFYGLLYEIIDVNMIKLVLEKNGRMIILPSMEVFDRALPDAPPETILFNTRELDRNYMQLFVGDVLDPDTIIQKLIRTFYENKMQSYQSLAIIEDFKSTPFSGSDEGAYNLINRDVRILFKYDISIYTMEQGKASPKGLCFFDSLLDAEDTPSKKRQIRIAEICKDLEISECAQNVKSYNKYALHYNVNIFVLDNTCTPVKSHHYTVHEPKATYNILFEQKDEELHFSFIKPTLLSSYMNNIIRRDKALENGKVCSLCRKAHVKILEEPYNKLCSSCNIRYTTKECYVNHKEICDSRHKCKKCKCIFNTDSEHKCNHETCLNCKKLVESLDNHKCHFKKPKVIKMTNTVIYFDFETLLDKSRHVVNFWAARIEIQEQKDKKDKVKTKAEIIRCQGDNINSFYEMIIKYNNSVIIAHNLRGYDGILLVEYMTENEIKFDIIKKGCKIVTLKIPEYNITALDSYAHLSYPLSDFPKAFGLKEMKKGYFPYKFNTIFNQKYIGTIPDVSYFEPERFKDEKSQKAFYKWYDENKDLPYDFMKELKEYCINDVELLADGFKKYRETLVKLTGYDPLNKITIASVSIDVFLTKFNNHKIALIDTNNYKYLADKAMTHLSLNNIDKDYISCYDVGCKQCFKHDIICPRRSKTMGDIWAVESQKIDFKNVIFEHDYLKMYKTGELIVDPIDEFIMNELTPQESLFGGYTETFKFYDKCLDNETIYYIDINSSYPAQMIKEIYFGHPTVIKSNFKDIKEYHGVVKCKILAPKGLKQGYLPVRINNKLKLPLCRTCAFNENNKKCECKNKDRVLYGSWFTHELKYAISKGYEIIKMYEVHHFKKPARSDDVFKEYINTLYRLKQEKSGIPSEFKDDKNKIIEYCKKYNLRIEELEDNPTVKNIAKALMNNTYGKTGENPNRNTKTEIVYDADDFPDIIFDYTKNINRIDINDGVMEIQTKQRGGFYFPKKTTNPYIAGLITAYGRVQLYSTMDKLRDLGCEILYCDTDSIVFNDKSKDISAFKAEHFDDYELGKWKLEVEKFTGTTEIAEFVSLGPKTYSFRMKAQNKESLKSKGFSLNMSTAKIINFDTYKEILDDNVLLKSSTESIPKSVSITSTLFKKGKCADGIISKELTKKLSFVYNKRRIIPGTYDTEPF